MLRAGDHDQAGADDEAEPTTVRQTLPAAGTAGTQRDTRSDLSILDAVIRMLPVGLTVQDERGNFLLVNEMAAAQLDTAARALADAPADIAAVPDGMTIRREAGIGVIRSGAPLMCEERVVQGQAERVLLTSHRPVRIGDRSLLLSTSVDFTEHKASETELSRRAYFDELTGLPKRTLIEAHVADRLQQDGARGRFALAFLDIDNFKHINDYYGHAAGDTLLVKVAKRLQADLDATDLLARISGDEFLLVLDPIDSETTLAAKIGQLLQRLKTPFFIDGFEIFASASIGVSLFPDHGTSYETLHQNADIAMYRVKSQTKGGFAIFDGGMEREAAARTELEQRLRQAILEKRFRCAFQPKVDIRSREIIGVEALVRLCDENGIIQAPGTFVNLAVELGLIDELTHLVLAEVTRSLDLIDDQFGPGASISINVAAKQATDAVFMNSLAHALAATGCPDRFMLEVTEDAFIRKQHFQSEILPILRDLGVRVSIDDFGTGYSSLSALADITADEIKIDRSFITDIHKRPRSQGILRAIESLSKTLGMTVIAEGVETFEELAYLQATTEIRYAQGYYFAKPLFVEEFAPAGRIAGESRAQSTARPQREDRQSQSRVRAGR
jgi:diguanylate cyclase (GGDEF)-like protein